MHTHTHNLSHGLDKLCKGRKDVGDSTMVFKKKTHILLSNTPFNTVIKQLIYFRAFHITGTALMQCIGFFASLYPSKNFCVIGTRLILSSKLRKLKHKSVKYHAQGHGIHKQQRHFKTGPQSQEVICLTLRIGCLTLNHST